MFDSMAADLGIVKYKNETTLQHEYRVIYSAIACWIKATSMDCPITDVSEVASGVSRRHITEKCSTVLAEMIRRFPQCRTWFDMDSPAENPIALLRSRLLRHGDLVNVGFDTNVALVASERIPLTQEIECIKGIRFIHITHPFHAVAYMLSTVNIPPMPPAEQAQILILLCKGAAAAAAGAATRCIEQSVVHCYLMNTKMLSTKPQM